MLNMDEELEKNECLALAKTIADNMPPFPCAMSNRERRDMVRDYVQFYLIENKLSFSDIKRIYSMTCGVLAEEYGLNEYSPTNQLLH